MRKAREAFNKKRIAAKKAKLEKKKAE